LDQAQSLGWDTTPLAEAEHVDSGARTNRGQKGGERRRRAPFATCTRRLIGLYCVWTKVRVYPCAAWEVDDKFPDRDPFATMSVFSSRLMRAAQNGYIAYPVDAV